MALVVNYYHFLISPWSYLAIGRFNELVDKHNMTVNYLPIAPMKVFGETGGLPPAKRHPSRQRFRMDELKRWSSWLNIPLNLTPKYFPADQTLAAQMLLAAGGASGNAMAGKFSDALLTAVWAEEKNIADESILISVADSVGLQGAELLNQAQTPAWADAYEAQSVTAIDIGVFGSTFNDASTIYLLISRV